MVSSVGLGSEENSLGLARSCGPWGGPSLDAPFFILVLMVVDAPMVVGAPSVVETRRMDVSLWGLVWV